MFWLYARQGLDIFGGRGVSVGDDSSVTIDPRVPELEIMREWYNRTNGEE